MKYAVASALFAAASATTCADFPRDSSMHAGCHMTVTFPQYSCDVLHSLIQTEVSAWGQPYGDSCRDSGFPGFYSLYLNEANCVWSTRLTANLVYTDDQKFEFAPVATGCSVTARSRSQSTSILDNCVNYCNMWNVFTGIGTFTIDSVTKCSQEPDVPATTCARY